MTTASVCFSRLLLHATAAGGVCDHVLVGSAIPGNTWLRGCQQAFDNTPRQLVFASLYYNYAT